MAKEIKDSCIDEELIEAFKEFGAIDADGYITKSELGATMERYNEKLSPQELEALYTETDKDQDGKVDFRDFMRMMMSK